jgi:translation initiation factor 1A
LYITQIMPKKDKGRKKHTGDERSRELIKKDDEQDYALAGKMLGDGRFKATCQDGKERLCIVRGTMRNRIWISEGDLILIGLRSFEDGKADVLHKYTPDEAKRLKKAGETDLQVGGATNSKDNSQRISNTEDDGFDFEAI